MTKYLSNKLRVLSFILICMVVFLHAQVMEFSPVGISILLQKFFTQRITRVAVSFFFLISGFLFCYTLDEDQKRESFKRKIKKRIHTLLIPFLIWSILCILFVAIMQRYISIDVDSSKVIAKYNLDDYIKQIFVNPTIAYQLWFIRDLFVVTLVSPIIYLLLRYLGVFFVAIVALFNIFFWHIGFLSAVSVAFFTFGMYVAMFYKKWPETVVSNRFWWTLPMVWFAFNIALEITGYGSMLTFFVNNIVGILSIWISYDLLYKRWFERWLVLDIFSFSFFIYIVHEPILTLCKKIYIKSIGVDTIVTSLLFYFLSPIAIISGIIIVGRFLKRRIPIIYNLLTGSR